MTRNKSGKISQAVIVSFTEEGQVFLVLTILVSGATLMNGHNLLYWLVSVCWVILGIGWVGSRRVVRHAAVTLVIPDEWYAATPVEVEAQWNTHENIKVVWQGTTWVQWGEGVCHAPRRGKMRVGEALISSDAPFGLFQARRSVVPRVVSRSGFPREEWVVFPLVRPMRWEEVEEVLDRYSGRTTSPHEPQEDLSSVRGYRSGDDPRRVHWKASAKRDHLMVKEMETLRHHEAVLQVPLAYSGPITKQIPTSGMPEISPDLEDREQMFSVIASALVELTHADRLVQLRVGGWASPFGTGRAHLLELLHVLAEYP